MALMQIQIDREFLTVCEEILKEDHSLEEWREIESDDMFQTPHYEGELNCTEYRLCFSYYDPKRDGGKLRPRLHDFGDQRKSSRANSNILRQKGRSLIT